MALAPRPNGTESRVETRPQPQRVLARVMQYLHDRATVSRDERDMAAFLDSDRTYLDNLGQATVFVSVATLDGQHAAQAPNTTAS